MVCTDTLKEMITKVPVNRQTGAEYLRQLFIADMDIRPLYDCDDMDPDDVPKSQRCQMTGARELSNVFGLVQCYGDCNFNIEVKQLAEDLKEKNMTSKQVEVWLPAVLGLFAAKGVNASDIQKKEWKAFFDEILAGVRSAGI